MIQAFQKLDAPYYVVKPHVSFEEYMELADEDSKCELVEGEVSSSVIPGFWLDVNWLFELPSEKDCLDKIVSE